MGIKTTGPTNTYIDWIAEKSTNGGPWSYVGAGSDLSASVYRMTEGVDTPRFHARRRAGELLPYTPFHQVDYNYRSDTGRYNEADLGSTVYRRVGGWVPFASIMSQTNLGDVLDPYLEDVNPQVAVQAAAAKIYSSGHDTLTALSELHKTVALFVGLKRRLVQLFDLSKLADNWLEYRYGWRILVLDMLELQKTIQNLDDARKRYSESTGSTQRFVESSTWTYTEGSQLEVPFSISDEITIGIRGSISADISPPKFQFNPVVTGWELVPFSFIVDWFINVGNVIEAASFLTVATNYTAAGGTLATIERTVSSQGYIVHPGSFSWSLEPPDGEAKFQVTTRVPQKVSITPFANVQLNVAKVTDLVALIWKAAQSGSFSSRLRL